ncbi:MAG: HDIG domain-containing protein [Bacteroidales bacterium]|nr:HDIG domain-containing protein [Bacteroidales bacterium]MBO5847039.1 HDIG domain-containing protein [Bacteroidales bacterium]MBO7270690.1 HDIG domain-containing protein [Bacteroidales bacterium]MBO7325181.1 HDIG domain-containing protein [Bacteroidales bacterium]
MIKKAFKLILFALAAAIIVYVYPREGRFRYQFQEGKPWRYGLLTAPYNFSIYKAEAQFVAEQDSALKQYHPYLQQNSEVLPQTLEKLAEDYQQVLRIMVPERYLEYLNEQLSLIYNAGIISAEELSQLEKEGHQTVSVRIDNIGETRDITSLFTAKKAYEALLSNLPRNINKNVLIRDCHIENYLHENCVYDKTTSQRVKEELLSSVSRTQGMVQRGERIIDQGEIVNHETFLKLDSFRRQAEKRNDQSGGNWVLLGQILWVALAMSMLAIYLYKVRPQIYAKTSDIVFILILVVTLCLLSALIIRNDQLLNIYMVPFAIITILVTTFFDSRTAFYAYMITILICAPISHFPFEFLMLQLAVGVISILTLKRLTQRSQLIFNILWILAMYCIAYTSISLMQEGSLSQIQWKMYVSFIINAVLLFSSYLLIYLFEWMFGYISDVTLVELANINSKLLREFSESCPGSFQHSLQVSNLASAAAQSINANAQLVRTGALYHDLGKMATPSYYTENQSDGSNPLLNLPMEEAAKIITDHVPNGLKIASQHRLPKVIKDFILTHHGASSARYFYTLYKNEHPDQEVPEGFFYPGPDPFSKETAILMMADTIEAASRSMKVYSDESISNLVESLIDAQFNEGRYKHVPITFQELELIKEVFKDKLRSIYHARIAYPKANA